MNEYGLEAVENYRAGLGIHRMSLLKSVLKDGFLKAHYGANLNKFS